MRRLPALIPLGCCLLATAAWADRAALSADVGGGLATASFPSTVGVGGQSVLGGDLTLLGGEDRLGARAVAAAGAVRGRAAAADRVRAEARVEGRLNIVEVQREAIESDVRRRLDMRAD